jgi:hypothetical protein
LRALVFEFQRTASRLLEMQSRQYLAEQRRIPSAEAPGPASA